MNVATLSASKGVSVMTACRIHNFGSPEVITLEDMEKPEPGEGERPAATPAVDARFRPFGRRRSRGPEGDGIRAKRSCVWCD